MHRAVAGLCLALVVAVQAGAQRIQLGGHLNVTPDSLEYVGTALGACVSPPFTADEFQRVAPRAMTTVSVKRADGTIQVRPAVRLASRGSARTVPMVKFLAEVNATEHFFNRHGYTLRSGPLKARRREVPVDGNRLAECVSRDSLGNSNRGRPLITYRLIDAPPASAGHDPGPLGIEHVHIPDIKPNPPGPGDVMGGVIDIRVIDPRVIDTRTIDTRAIDTQIGINPVNVGELTVAGKRLLNTRMTVIPGPVSFKNVPARKVMSDSCPAVCSYELGKTAFLTAEAQALIDNPDEVIFVKHGCKIDTDAGNNAEKCAVGFKTVVHNVTRRWQWGQSIDVDFFLKNFSTPCAVIAHEHVEGSPYTKGLYTLSPASSGTEVITVGETAPNFFDGALHYKNTGIADCVVDVGSNSLFGTDFCLNYNTANDYTPSTGFHIVNDAGVRTTVTLFGMTFNLVSGKATVDWTQPVSPTSAVPPASPAVSSTLSQSNDTQHFEGPGATFLIGPIPLTVRTFADATLTVGAPVPSFTPPPLVKDVAGGGHIGMAVSSGTDVSLGMDAAIDAVVLSAGISGKLSLLNNSVDGGISSSILPSQNELRVQKVYAFQATSLKGTISAFVEVDLLVYSERYSVDLVSFPGTTQTWLPTKKSWGPAHAVIPSTASSGPVCAR